MILDNFMVDLSHFQFLNLDSNILCEPAEEDYSLLLNIQWAEKNLSYREDE